MNPKLIKRLLIVLFILVSFTMVYRVIYNNNPKKLAFQDITVGKTSKIELISPENRVVLEKKADAWQITSPIFFKANPEFIETLIAGIKKVSLKNVISNNTEKFEKFKVSDSSADVVTVYASTHKEPVSLIVGKQSTQNYSNVYVRLKGKNEVYDTEGPQSHLFRKTAEDWRDKTIIAVKKGDISEINLVYKNETIKIFRKDKSWLLDDPETGSPVNEAELNTLLDTLEKFAATDILTPEKQAQLKVKTGIDKPEFEMIIKTAAPQQTRLIVGSVKTDYKYYLKREGDENIFQVFEYQITNLRKDYAKLKKTETPQETTSPPK